MTISEFDWFMIGVIVGMFIEVLIATALILYFASKDKNGY